MKEHLPVVVLGATGSIGQRFVQLLDGHPFFKVAALTGSERTAGRPYWEACRWVLAEPMPAWAREMVVHPSDPSAFHARLAFSALPADEARPLRASLRPRRPRSVFERFCLSSRAGCPHSFAGGEP